jgi:hypothetical protein
LCSDETTENVRQTFVVRSPRKSTKRDSLELNIPKTTALQAIQLTIDTSVSDGDEKRLEFCDEMFDKMESEDD